MNQTDAYRAVEDLTVWSEWVPFDDAGLTAPRLPGVYLFRLPDTHQIVYVGTAGERRGGGTPQGLRGRLQVYGRGKGAVSGFGEAARDRALSDEHWVKEQLVSLRTHGPSRAKVWAQKAIDHLGVEVRWATTDDKATALALEGQKVGLLRPFGLWNRPSGAAATAASSTDVSTDPAVPADGAPSAVMGDLFEPLPGQWGLRGDPYVWEVMRNRLAGEPVTPTRHAALLVLARVFEEVVGVDPLTVPLREEHQRVYREEFAHGGMSSGYVDVLMWQTRLLPMLAGRVSPAG